jgi:hypothetical protein
MDREDFTNISREITRLLLMLDPAAADIVLRAAGSSEDPRAYAVALLEVSANVYAERSSGENSAILNRMNHYVSLEDGSPIRSLTVVLSPQEREIYSIEEIDLAQLPDRSEFVANLRRVAEQLREEPEDQEERR